MKTDLSKKSIKSFRVWLGGSFDPVHLGHLAIISHIANRLNDYFICHPLENTPVIISLLPTAQNPLKVHSTSAHHRLAMLELALQALCTDSHSKVLGEFSSHEKALGKGENYPTFQIDTTEIYQTETVFTFNTVSHFRKVYPDDSLIFVLGRDSILTFEKWYRGFELPNLCHLWVMPRVTQNDGNNTENSIEKTVILPSQLSPFLTDNVQDLISLNKGRIYLDTYQVLSVSSSQIRATLKDNKILSEHEKSLLLPYLTPSVLDYILKNQLYY